MRSSQSAPPSYSLRQALGSPGGELRNSARFAHTHGFTPVARLSAFSLPTAYCLLPNSLDPYCKILKGKYTIYKQKARNRQFVVNHLPRNNQPWVKQ